MASRYFWGTKTQYGNLHRWVKAKKGTATDCIMCDHKGKSEWANVSGDYPKDVNDYINLCRPCHRKFDNDSYQDEPLKTHCKRGHEFTAENTYLVHVDDRPRPRRVCNECRRIGESRRYWLKKTGELRHELV